MDLTVVAAALIPEFCEQYMETLEGYKREQLEEEKTLEVSAEAMRLLREARIPKLGKKKSFGGFVINTRERHERRRRDRINPDFNVNGHRRDHGDNG